jgi:hypothetical protein
LECKLVFHPACGDDGAKGEEVVGHWCYFWVVSICFGFEEPECQISQMI